MISASSPLISASRRSPASESSKTASESFIEAASNNSIRVMGRFPQYYAAHGVCPAKLAGRWRKRGRRSAFALDHQSLNIGGRRFGRISAREPAPYKAQGAFRFFHGSRLALLCFTNGASAFDARQSSHSTKLACGSEQLNSPRNGNVVAEDALTRKPPRLETLCCIPICGKGASVRIGRPLYLV